MHWKYEADKNLVKRTGFNWIILRPGGLTNNQHKLGSHILETENWEAYPATPRAIVLGCKNVITDLNAIQVHHERTMSDCLQKRKGKYYYTPYYMIFEHPVRGEMAGH